MFSRQKVLAAMGILAGWGCHKAPELPPRRYASNGEVFRFIALFGVFGIGEALTL